MKAIMIEEVQFSYEERIAILKCAEVLNDLTRAMEKANFTEADGSALDVANIAQYNLECLIDKLDIAG